MTRALLHAASGCALPSVLLSALALGTPGSATAQVVSPADRTGLEGSTSTTYPLGRFDCRLQMLHGDLGAARTLHGHAYRRDAIATNGSVEGYQTELSVTLSVAGRAPDAASRTFADNVGTGAVVVLPRGVVSFPTTDRPAGAPAPSFEFAIPYATPFQFPGNGASLCVDVEVFGNQRGTARNVNFTPYLDAHDVVGDGSNEQPGYRFGTGCSATGTGTAHNARLTFRASTTGLALEVASRNGLPTTATDPALVAMLVGLQRQDRAWPGRPGCTVFPTLDADATLPGNNDALGSWDGTLPPFAGLPVGQEFVVQLVSGQPSTGALTFSDGTVIAVPPPGPTRVTVARIAHATDHTSATGTVSTSVPVVRFF